MDKKRNSMPAPMRRASIVEQVRRHRGLTVAELVDHFEVSPITISRDLDRLHDEGLLRRVRGGAVVHDPADFPQPSGQVETEWARRQAQAAEQKKVIAQHAVTLVRDGSTIFVDHSTTTLALARAIERAPVSSLTLVTNSPALAHGFRSKHVHVIVACGELDQTVEAIGGPWTVEFLERLNFQAAFLSAGAASLEQGLMTSRPLIADTLSAVHAISERTFALVDSTKLERSALISFLSLQDVDGLIVDKGMPVDLRQRYEGAGVKLQVVGGDDGGEGKRLDLHAVPGDAYGG